MKKRLIYTLLATLLCVILLPGKARAEGGVEINETNFPDTVFRAYVSKEFDENRNGALSTTELGHVSYIDVEYLGIQSLVGIEFFTTLEYLYCGHNQLVFLDVSENSLLESLSCNDNALISLDVKGNLKLRSLSCYNNNLSEIDLSHNSILEYIDCEYNSLTTLDLSKNNKLETLYCSNNAISTLNLSMNKSLITLSCNNNELETLDLSNNTYLESIFCYENHLSAINLDNNTLLEYLDCENNQLTFLDLSCNTLLKTVYCSNNRLLTLNGNVSRFLEELSCSKNKLTVLDLSNNTFLKILSCYDNNLTVLDLSNNTNLKALDCSSNYIKELDIRKNPYLLKAYQEGSKYNYGDSIRFELEKENDYWYFEFPSSTELIAKVVTPKISAQPKLMVAKAGQIVTFKVKATGGELSYQWYSKKPGASTWTKMTGKTSAKLSFTAKTSHNGYKYHCEVKNSAGKMISKAATLTVVTKPKVTTQPKAASVAAGKAVTFKLKASGGKLKYQWYVMKAGTTKWTKLSGKTAETLKLTAKKSMNGNKYRCRVKNIAGSVYSKTVKLTVK